MQILGHFARFLRFFQSRWNVGAPNRVLVVDELVAHRKPGVAKLDAARGAVLDHDVHFAERWLITDFEQVIGPFVFRRGQRDAVTPAFEVRHFVVREEEHRYAFARVNGNPEGSLFGNRVSTLGVLALAQPPPKHATTLAPPYSQARMEWRYVIDGPAVLAFGTRLSCCAQSSLEMARWHSFHERRWSQAVVEVDGNCFTER